MEEVRPCLLCLFACSAGLLAQQSIPADELQLRASSYLPPALTSLKVETRLVEVGVVVRDSRGHPVAGLTKDDFEVDESGRPREITAFSIESALPLESAASAGTAGTAPPAPAADAAKRPARLLALVFDDFAMSPSDLMSSRAAARRFFSQGLQAGDTASVFSVSKGQLLPFTSDTARIDQALASLSVHARDAGMSSCPYLTSYEAMTITERLDSTVLTAKVQEARTCGLCQPRDTTCPSKVEGLARMVWEQQRDTSRRTILFLGEVVKYLAKLPGRRIVVLASSGFLSRTLEQDREDMIDRALRAQVVINALDAKGLFTQDMGTSSPAMSLASARLRQSLGTRPQLEANDSLAILSEGTGGLFFHNNNDLTLGFRELGLAPAASYSLGFSPANPPDNRYHLLKVRLKKKGSYSIQARPGYFAQVLPVPLPVPERPIDKEILAADTLNDVPVAVTASSVVTDQKEPAVRLVLHLDVQHLPFANPEGVRTNQVSLVAVLFDDHSSPVAGREAHASFALKKDTFQRLAGGLNLSLTLVAPPGAYRLRCVIQDEPDGKFTAITQPVEIHPAGEPKAVPR